MSWEPRLSLLPLAPFRKNVVAYITGGEGAARFEAALRWAEQQAGWEGDPLPNLFGVYSSRAVREQYPVLNLLPLGNDPEPNADGGEAERKRLLCEFENIGDDAEVIFEQLEIYDLALRSILREMPEEVMTAGIDTATRGDFRWAVGTERFGERGYDGENLFVQVSSQVLTIDYTEDESYGED